MFCGRWEMLHGPYVIDAVYNTEWYTLWGAYVDLDYSEYAYMLAGYDNNGKLVDEYYLLPVMVKRDTIRLRV
jgi:hypothetical protein